MFLEIAELLTSQEVDELRAIASQARFVDGRMTNPHAKEKDSLLISDPPRQQRSAQIMIAALARSEEFKNFAFPKVLATPALSIYRQGGRYGKHSDAAFMPLDAGGRMLRSDLSCTIFIADPDSYDGGELVSQLGTREVRIKGSAGSAVVYPSTTLHAVTPVTRGERLVGLTFVESRIKDPTRRDVMYELNEVAALEGLRMDWDNRTRLQRARDMLMRMWAEG